jgi:GT2 family glycosyltransferase/glycosyltransferase involved in cell wall biosynthesis
MKPCVTIIIPVYGQLLYTKQVLKSIAEHKTVMSSDLRVTVVDNGSSDGTLNWLLSNWLGFGSEEVESFQKSLQSSADGTFVAASDGKTTPYSAKVIASTTNRGFGPAINLALGEVLAFPQERDVLVMNNDMELLPECIDALIGTAYAGEINGAGIGIVGGKLLHPDGTIQHAGAFLNANGWGQHKLAGLVDSQIRGPQFVEEQEYVTGALFYIKHDLLKVLPAFDPQFTPAFFEEVDYCYEARKLGFKTVYSPYAHAIHYEGVTAKGAFGGERGAMSLSLTNQVRFYVKRDDDYLEYDVTSDKRLLLCCEIHDPWWSYAGVARNLARGLSKAGVDVAIAPDDNHSQRSLEDWDIKEMVQKPHDYWNRVVLRTAEGSTMFAAPPSHKKRVAHTTGESDMVPWDWVDQLNHMDQVLTTSAFFRDVLHGCGVETHIDVLPNPIDTSIFKPNPAVIRPPELRGFNFVSVFQFSDRKGPDLLLRAFAEEFKPTEDVTLTVHSLSMMHVIEKVWRVPLKQWADSVMGTTPHAPIILSMDALHGPLMGDFYNRYDCFVLASRAEGFCLPLVEAAACGLPSIATNYSGITDFLTPDVGYPVDYHLVDIPLQQVPWFKNYIGGKWAQPSVEHLRAQMRYAFEHRDDVVAKGMAAYQKAQHYSLYEIGSQAKQLIFGDINE